MENIQKYTINFLTPGAPGWISEEILKEISKAFLADFLSESPDFFRILRIFFRKESLDELLKIN